MFEKFINLYSLSKTLKFELQPQGNTLVNIQKKGLLTQDLNRSEAYKKVKIIIDEYHKYFMNEVLTNTRIINLIEYAKLYEIPRRDENQKKEFEDVQKKMRKVIADHFTKHELYTKMDKADLFKISKDTSEFKGILSKWIFSNKERIDFILEKTKLLDKTEIVQLLKDFESFSTYFKGFHENRKNLYSAEDISTAIAHRILHQNLPKYLDNIKIFKKILSSSIDLDYTKIFKDYMGKLNLNRVEDYFELENFNLTLSQQGIDEYNQMLGGFTIKDGINQVQGINQYINLFNQKQNKKEDKLPRLKPLFKQILSDRNTVSFLPDKFKNDKELLEGIDSFYQELNTNVLEVKDNNITSLPELLNNIDSYDLSKIYIRNDVNISTLSQSIFGTWNTINQAIHLNFENEYKGKQAIGSEGYENERDKKLKSIISYTIEFLDNCIGKATNESKEILNYYKNLGLNINKYKDIINIFEEVQKNYNSIESILKSYPSNKKLISDDNTIFKIKLFLDSIKSVQQLIKPLLGNGDESDKDEKFYGELDKLSSILNQITPLYNKVRNYLTQKPYSIEKYKLNFENPTLLDGWDTNKEEANTCILFKQNSDFFLGIMDKKNNKIFRKIPKTKTNNVLHKINYKLLPGASKMLPKVFFSASNIDNYAPSQEILRIRNHGSHTKSGKPQEGFEKHEFNLSDCQAMINFYKSAISKHRDWVRFNFEFKETNYYDSIDQFYKDVEHQGYNMSYSPIDRYYLDEMVNQGKLYLFKIYNKDFSSHSKGIPNMHTLYWKILFDERNLDNVVYKLNGEAEIFYRKASIHQEERTIHSAKKSISNKNLNNKKKESIFNYDIIKDKRFTDDKFQFHVPISLNFKAEGRSNVNDLVKQVIKDGHIKHVIGIDRGERHLLYLSLIDTQGSIIKQLSLNEIVNEYKSNIYSTNYHALLTAKEVSRDEARKNWKTIENIKELKEGYLSQVIHIISKWIIEYKAIVVLEDLNFGFKQGRQKVEKSVYQKFEKMLIDKLNYYVDKKKDSNEIGGLLNALQLTSEFESFKKLDKQSGYLFYIPAWNTSKLDPVTGFVNFFDCKYESIDKAMKFFDKFHSIKYNKYKDYFEFAIINYTQFNPKSENTRQDWIICTNGERIENFKNSERNNNWDSRQVNLTQQFKDLFINSKINYEESELKAAILDQKNKAFFENIFYLFKLTLQMRNSMINSDIDYLISPVANKMGEFFDSRKQHKALPLNADANGAYNIARKGLWAMEQIQQAKDIRKVNLTISNGAWLQFAQNSDQ